MQKFSYLYSMNPDLAHLPEEKQLELAEIIKIIREVADPSKVILFGSHTGNDWVDDVYVENGITYSYKSDYDILVVIEKGDKEKEHEIASKIENRTLKYENDVSPIVHSIEYINKGLEDGQYFFRDIIADGIYLFDTKDVTFIKPKPLTLKQQKVRAEYYYEKWVESGIRFFGYTKTSLKDALKENQPLNEVIFMLHQTAERFYGGLLTVFTGYKPKTHKLKVYRKYAKNISESLNQIFRYPLEDVEEYRLFDIFNKSYLDSRYKDHYFISKEDLEKLIQKVDSLEAIVIKICQEKIASLGS